MPLRGKRVIDLTRILAGPFATMMLGDLGAEVVKIERPGTGDETRGWGPPFADGVSTYYLSVNRNKKSITLDLKSARGREILWELLEDADVLVSNFRPGVMERLGFDREVVARRCPQVVYAVISGYGDEGPWARRPSFDLIAQAESGLMELTGEADGPPTKVGITLGDEAAGLYLVQGILAALLAREGSGRGQRVEVALHDALLSLFTYQAQGYLSCGVEPRRLGSAHPSIVPYRMFPTADDPIVVGVGSETLWGRFCDALDVGELEDDPRFATNARRVDNRVELEELLSARLRERTAADWLEILDEAEVPCGPVRKTSAALDGELTRLREMVVRAPGGGPRMLGIPVKLDDTPGGVASAPPTLGEHTGEILRELGYPESRIETLRRAGVV